MTIQSTTNFYKVATQHDSSWIAKPIMVYKRLAPFVWQAVDVEFDTVEDAQEYIKFADLIEWRTYHESIS